MQTSRRAALHEGARVAARSRAAEGVVGITDFAQDALGDVVFVELPAVGHGAHRGADLRRRRVEQERVRPLRAGRGQVVEVNEALRDAARSS